MHINQISIEHVERLKDIQLTQLLHSLIQVEINKFNLNGAAFVPLNITTGDGGEDGRVEWINGPEETRWFKNRLCLFQCKATKMTGKQCYEEVIQGTSLPGNPLLKPMIQQVVSANGCYILFINKCLNTKQKTDRIAYIRSAFQISGNENFETICIEIYDSNDIKDWVNENIGSVTLVQKFNNIDRPAFKTWYEWMKMHPGSEVDYRRNEFLESHQNRIRYLLMNGGIVRVVGHSGLGKTRMVLETFRNDPQHPDNLHLQQQLVYMQIGSDIELPALSAYITSHQNQEGILVIDNCDDKTHGVISNLVRSLGRFKLITIDASTDPGDEFTVKLERTHQTDIVKEIINSYLKDTHGRADKDYLSSICEGYPWLAINFCIAIQKIGIDNFSGQLSKEFIQRLLFGRSAENQIEYEIIRACAVFSAFGFPDEKISTALSKEQQADLAGQVDFIRTQVFDGNVSETKFYETCQKYKSKDILERRGSFYIVRPTVLAVNLAAEWFQNTPTHRVIRILEQLQGKPLSQRFVERLKDLDNSNQARQIVHELWGPSGPFGSTEVLNTEWGSQLFCLVLEVNPTSALLALEAAYGKVAISELRQIKAGRRNLVQALTKLCFRKETFQTAARLLYRFSVAENETWANNATGQFVQLFQLFLAGTEEALIPRLSVIDYGLEQNDPSFNELAVKALGQALINNHFTRTGGPERQGFKPPLKDYYPKSWPEIHEYWNEALSRLTNIACGDPNNSDLAKEKIAGAFIFLVRDHAISMVAESIRLVTNNFLEFWPEGYNSLKKAILYNKNLPDETRKIVFDLLEKMQPINITDKLFMVVTKPEWDDFEEDENGNLIDHAKMNAELFAEELANKGVNLVDFLLPVMRGEHRQSNPFGSKIGELYTDNALILNHILEVTNETPAEVLNVEFIYGFLQGANDENLTNRALDYFIANKHISHHAFYLTKFLKPDLDSIMKLFHLVDESKVSVSLFKTFQYGGALKQLQAKEVIVLCNRLSTYETGGPWSALSLFFSYCYNDLKNWEDCKAEIRSLLVESNMLTVSIIDGKKEYFHWSHIADQLLKDNKDIAFAQAIANQIVDFCRKPNFDFAAESYIRSVLTYILDKYFEDSWDIIGEAIIGDYLPFYHLKFILDNKRGEQEYCYPFFNNSESLQYLKEWMHRHSEIGPGRLAGMIPLEYDSTAQEPTWHPLAKFIIDEYGSNPVVLEELSANMGAFTTYGSVIPLYQKYIALLQQLTDHKFELVRSWTRGKIDYFQDQIIKEGLMEEDRFM